MASLRAAQTIKDLLTLGRQGRTAKENLDINRVIKSCWANSSLRFVERTQPAVPRQHDRGPRRRRRWSSAARSRSWRRAVDNLIRNAVEAIGGNGEVVVKSARSTCPSRGRAMRSFPPVATRRCPCPTTAAASSATSSARSSNPSSPRSAPRRPPGPAWASPSSTASSRNTRATSTSPARRAWEPPSLSTSRSRTG